MSGPFKAVAVQLIVADSVEFYKVSTGRKEGFFVGVCNDRHKRVVIWGKTAAPVGFRVIWVASYRPRFVNQLPGLDSPSLCDAEGAIVVISCSKANRVCVDFLPGV